ncbi:MAG: hypothetical protein PHR35_19765, partial [Kiritimatiellae bacterium]|nr:hypothetical protein [Kiritimatiellia bacterium]
AIVSEEGILASRIGPELTTPFITHAVVKSLLRCGAPIDFYRLQDVARMPDYRLYVFLNAFYVTRPLRQAWHKKLAHNHATALWVHAAGYASETGLSVATMRDLTGIAFQRHALRALPEVRITNAEDPLTRGSGGGARYGSSLATGPLFTARPENGMRVLGLLQATGNGDGGPGAEIEVEGPGLVVAPQAQWTSIWSAAPQLPPGLLRRLAREAGAHVYLDTDDWLAADSGLVAVHAGSSGPRRIELPQATAVYDLRAQRLVTERASHIDCNLIYGDTAAYLLAGDPAAFAGLDLSTSPTLGEVELWHGNQTFWSCTSATATFNPGLDWPNGHQFLADTGIPLTLRVRDGMGRQFHYDLPASDTPALLDLTRLQPGPAGANSLTLEGCAPVDWSRMRRLVWGWTTTNGAPRLAGILDPPAIAQWFVSDPIPDPQQRRLDCPTPLDDDLARATGPLGRKRLESLGSWNSVMPEGSVINLPVGPASNHQDVVALAWANIESDTPRRVTLGIGSDDGIRVWLNGRQVLDSPTLRALTPGEDLVDVELTPGTNELVVKCSQAYGGWAFAVEVSGTNTSMQHESGNRDKVGPQVTPACEPQSAE